jgi:hypothetical protein
MHRSQITYAYNMQRELEQRQGELEKIKKRLIELPKEIAEYETKLLELGL